MANTTRWVEETRSVRRMLAVKAVRDYGTVAAAARYLGCDPKQVERWRSWERSDTATLATSADIIVGTVHARVAQLEGGASGLAFWRVVVACVYGLLLRRLTGETQDRAQVQRALGCSHGVLERWVEHPPVVVPPAILAMKTGTLLEATSGGVSRWAEGGLVHPPDGFATTGGVWRPGTGLLPLHGTRPMRVLRREDGQPMEQIAGVGDVLARPMVVWHRPEERTEVHARLVELMGRELLLAERGALAFGRGDSPTLLTTRGKAGWLAAQRLVDPRALRAFCEGYQAAGSEHDESESPYPSQFLAGVRAQQTGVVVAWDDVDYPTSADIHGYPPHDEDDEDDEDTKVYVRPPLHLDVGSRSLESVTSSWLAAIVAQLESLRSEQLAPYAKGAVACWAAHDAEPRSDGGAGAPKGVWGVDELDAMEQVPWLMGWIDAASSNVLDALNRNDECRSRLSNELAKRGLLGLVPPPWIRARVIAELKRKAECSNPGQCDQRDAEERVGLDTLAQLEAEHDEGQVLACKLTAPGFTCDTNNHDGALRHVRCPRCRPTTN